jgi:small subunit ribosomal protein S21
LIQGTDEPAPDHEGKVTLHVAQVKIRRGETIEKAMRRLKKIMDKEGIMKEIRAHRYFEKPSEQRRRKAARARARAAYNI